MDHVERDEHGDEDRRQAHEQAELLGDPDVARPGRDADPDPHVKAASSGVNSTWASRSGPWISADAIGPAWRRARTRPRNSGVDGRRRRRATGARAARALPRRNSSRRDRRRQDRLEGALLPLAGHRRRRRGTTGTRIGMPSMYSSTCSCAPSAPEDSALEADHRDERLDHEDQREESPSSRRSIGCDGTRGTPCRTIARHPTSSSGPSRAVPRVVIDELEVDVLERVLRPRRSPARPAPAATSARVTPGAATAGSETARTYVSGASWCQRSTPGRLPNTRSGLVERARSGPSASWRRAGRGARRAARSCAASC